MEKDQQQKHRCKVCRKCFPCGRSLGGHMRSHVSANSSLEADERPPPQSNRSSVGFGAGYGLRENPKKTTRLYDLGGPLSSQREKQCEECGKEFQSWKALFGHMRCHSARPHRSSKEDEEQEQEEQEGSWSGGTHKVVLESLSDNEVVMVPRRKRRSRRMAAIPSPCSSASEHELEQEDVAVSLMMLSRDVGFWGGFHSVAESSDKNSVVLENKGMGEEGDGDFGSDGCEIGKAMKLGIGRKGSESKNGLSKMESDASDDGFVRDDDEFKKPKVFEESDEESGKGSSKKKNLNYGLDESGKKTGFNRRKRDRIDVYDVKFGREYVARFGFDAPNGDFSNAPERRSRYECTTCNKTFHSYQALGGHRASHKRVKGGLINGCENSMESIKEMIDQSAGTETSNGSSRRIKSHECTICGKVFLSGQALGGHKRSHLAVASSDGRIEATSQPIVVLNEPSVMPDLLDLNLPAPMDGDSTSTNGNSEFKSWWARSNLKHEQVMGMISN